MSRVSAACEACRRKKRRVCTCLEILAIPAPPIRIAPTARSLRLVYHPLTVTLVLFRLHSATAAGPSANCASASGEFANTPPTCDIAGGRNAHATLPGLATLPLRRDPAAHRLRGLPREYITILKRARQKYWDRDYVRSLEDQVRLLSVRSPTGAQAESLAESTAEGASSEAKEEYAESARMEKALSDLTSLNWPIYGNDNAKEPLFTGPGGYFTIPFRVAVPVFETADVSKPPARASVSSPPVELVQGLQLAQKQNLKKHFLEHINSFYNFVDPTWLTFSDLFPDNDSVLQLLYSTIFAISSFYSPDIPVEMHTGLLKYAESIVLECARDHLCFPVLQSLLMLSWFKHGNLDNTAAYMYHYMVIGLSTFMKVNEICNPTDETQTPDVNAESDLEKQTTLRTFWSLVFLDGYSTPTLGAPPRLPWDVSEAPSMLTKLQLTSIDTPALAFEFHLRLLRFQQEFIHPIYQRKFPSLPQSEQDAMFLRGYNALTALRRSIDPRLIISRSTPPHNTQVVFWISYRTAEINLYRRFLDPKCVSPKHASAIRAMTAAACGVTRMLRLLDSMNALHTVPPFVIYHVLRAGLVHALNMTAEDERIRRTARARFHLCLDALGKIEPTWPVFSLTVIEFLRRVVDSWGVGLPQSYDITDVLLATDSDEENDDPGSVPFGLLGGSLVGEFANTAA